MKTFKIIWIVIAIIWLIILNLDLSIDLIFAKSAVQASQVYNKATVAILGIIAFTLLLLFGNEPNNKSIEQIENQTKALFEQSKRIADVLDLLKQHIDGPVASITTVPEYIDENKKEIEQTSNTLDQTIKQPPTITLVSPPCPKCHAPMIIRTATKGEQKGNRFYVCSNFPKCQEIKPVL